MGYYIFKVHLKIYLSNYTALSLECLLRSKYLSDAEKLSFGKYQNENVKKEKIASLILKNKYIGQYRLNEFGKPISDHKHFNISHSHGYIALVIDEVDVGLDIEKIREADSDLRNYISNDEEKKYIHDDTSFFEVWTNKEALVKATGNGINQKINTIPSLPLNSLRSYDNKTFFNKTIQYQNLVMSVSRNSEENFDLEVIEEVI